MEAILERVEEAKENLLPASNTHEFDVFVKGMIYGFYEILDIKPQSATNIADEQV